MILATDGEAVYSARRGEDMPDQFIRLPRGTIDLASVNGITIDGTVITIVWANGSVRTTIDHRRVDGQGFPLGLREEDERNARVNFDALSDKLEAHRTGRGDGT